MNGDRGGRRKGSGGDQKEEERRERRGNRREKGTCTLINKLTRVTHSYLCKVNVGQQRLGSCSNDSHLPLTSSGQYQAATPY